MAQVLLCKIYQGETNKYPANRWGSFGAKGGVVPPSVYNQLLKCMDKIHTSYTTSLLILTCDSGDPRLQHTVMEFVDLLSMAWMAVMAVVFAAVVFAAAVFVFLHQWSLLGHGNALQKEKTVTLSPFWAARPVAWFAFAESKFSLVLNGAVLISCWLPFRRRFWTRSWTLWTTSQRTSPTTP
jgi:hypothetical protein